jgi:Copper type II ascorbate-dependent monooxygenase, C-terminal domain
MIRMPWARTAALAAWVSTLGCGDADPETAKVNNDTRNQAEENCKPGETRCIDSHGAALCPASTGYAGDGLQLCTPANEQEGVLLHYGATLPNGQLDPAQVDKYLLPPGGEEEECVYVRSTNTQPMYIDAYMGRLRPNSHHLIVTMLDEQSAKDVVLNEPQPCNQAELFGSTWLLGSQDPQIDIFVEGAVQGADKSKPGDPEFGSGQLLQPNQVLRIDAHYINATDKPILREAWLFLRATPKEKVLQTVEMITFFQTAINVPPQTLGVVTARASCVAPTDRYVALVTGHFHNNGKRFSVWWNKADGTSEQIYNTLDWDTPGNGFYNPRVVNPALDGKAIWGAKSGYVKMTKGESLSFECEFDNPTDTPVRFGELGKDQMCNVFGMYYPSDGNQWRCNCLGTLCL